MKLTNTIRDAIITKCVESTFKKRQEEVLKKRKELANLLYQHHYGAHAKIAKKLPNGWVRQGLRITVSHPGFGINGASRELELDAPQPMPMYTGETVKVPDQYAALADWVAKETVDVEQAIYGLRERLKSLLYAYTTTEKLADAWPEGEKFIPRTPKAVPLPVPVTVMQEINRMMGLR